jgi:phage-related holin
MRMKNILCTAAGVVGSFIASLFGGWDTGIGTLVLFMVIDFLSGLAVAGIFKRSTKTKTGALE